MTSPPFAPSRRPGARSIVTGSIVAVVTLFLVWTLSPWLWFTDTTPTGGDMGAHVWSPAFLRDELLPDFRLTGWSSDWYAGFPAFSFYMIIPSLLIVMINVGIDLDPNIFSLVAMALAVSEITSRLRLMARVRLAAVATICGVGVVMSTWYADRLFDTGLFGWSPIEPFRYNDTSVDLAIITIVFPAAVGSLVWRLVAERTKWRGAITTVAVLTTILVVPVPYGVAMKLVVVAGLVTLPLAAYAAGRLGGLAFPGPALLSVMTLPFLFDRSYNIYGGNLMSTMAGEFAYSLGLAIAVLYLGVAARGLQTGRDRGLAAVLLALAGLTHLFAAFFALVGTLALFLLRPGKREISWLVVAGPLAGLLAAFWVLPFYLNRSMLNDMGWGKERLYLDALWKRSGNFGGQDFLVNDPPLQLFVVLAIIGAVVCGVRRVRFGMALSLVAMVFAALFVLLPEGRLWNVRILPFYYLSIYLMAGIALAEMSRFVADALRTPDAIREHRPTAAAAVPAVLTALVVIGAIAFPLRSVPFASTFQSESGAVYGFDNVLGLNGLGGLGDFSTTGLNFGPGWLRYNFSGYEQKSGTLEYTDMVATMRQVGEEFGCGQSLWEFESERLGSYGTTMAPMLLPHWTDRCIGSMEGLYFEASATTPYHFLLQSELSVSPSNAQRDLPYSSLDIDKGVDGMHMLGVRYYLAFSESAVAEARAHRDLEEIATSGPWVIFLLDGHDVVAGLDHMPVVLDGIGVGGEKWLIPTVAAWDAGPDIPLLAASGPPEWPRMSLDDLEAADASYAGVVGGEDPRPEMRVLTTVFPDWLERVPTQAAVVTEVRTDNSSISFTVDRVGTPVLVRTSYFPNWDVSGAQGPYRVSPNLMVVVPTENEVELTYGRSRLELISIGLTIMGLVGLVLVARLPATVNGPALWDISGPALALPDRNDVFDDVRAGVMSRDQVDGLRHDLEAERRRAASRSGVALALGGLSALLAAVLDFGADQPAVSLVVFGPLVAGIVIFVFAALPVLLRVGPYQRHVITPARLMAEMRQDPVDPAPRRLVPPLW